MYKSSLLLLVLSGCGGSQNTGANASGNGQSAAETTERLTEGGLTMVEVDLNGDGRAEVYNYYRARTQAARLLVRREADLNQDGRIDIWSFFDETGSVTQEKMDGDFIQTHL